MWRIAESELEMLRRFSRRGHALIERQLEIIVELGARGMSAELAESMLATLERVQEQFMDRLNRAERADWCDSDPAQALALLNPPSRGDA